MLDLSQFATYLGPSPWADEPVVTARLALRDWSAFDSAAARLEALCAEWFTRAETSSDDPEVVAGEFIAGWARDLLNRQNGRIVEAGAVRVGADVVAHLGYHQPHASLQALELAVRLLTDSASTDEDSITESLAEFRAKTASTHPDFQAALLIEHARRTNLPWHRLEGTDRLWRYGWGAKGTTMFLAMPMTDSSLGVTWSRGKAYTKGVFRQLGAPVAPSMIVRAETELPQAAERIGFPCVAKPVDGRRSAGVTTHIRSLADLRAAFGVATQTTRIGVMVERQIEGELIRIMVMRGKVWRAIRRNRPATVADGRSTVTELLTALNRSRHENEAPNPELGPVPIDDEFRAALRDQGLAPDDTPAAGRVVRLRNIPLLATGARYDDVTGLLHPETKAMAETLARYLGIQACGLDLITEDPAQSCHQLGAFIEINHTPNLVIPFFCGVPEDEIGRAVLGDDLGRVPSLLVVAAAESREEIRRLLPADNTLGWASGELAGLGSATLSGRRPTVHASTLVVLRHPLVRSIVVIATAAEIEGRGLPLDRVDRAIVMPGAGLDDTWAAVVRRRSGGYQETDDPAQVGHAVAALGRAEPTARPEALASAW